jgi:hypothetical protein
MIECFSLSMAGILLAFSSIGALAQINSPPPITTTIPSRTPYTPSTAPGTDGQPPAVSNPGNDINFPGSNMDNPLGKSGAAPGSAADSNR